MKIAPIPDGYLTFAARQALAEIELVLDAHENLARRGKLKVLTAAITKLLNDASHDVEN